MDQYYVTSVKAVADFCSGKDQQIAYLEFLGLINKDAAKKSVSYVDYLDKKCKLKFPFLYSNNDLDSLPRQYAPNIGWVCRTYSIKRLGMYSLTPNGEEIAKCYLEFMEQIQ